MSDYRVVPVEPTSDMLCSGIDAYGIEDCLDADVHAIYTSMIDAAPAVQGEPVGWQLDLPDGRVFLEKEYPEWAEGGDGYRIAPLYAAPQMPTDVQPDPLTCMTGKVCGGDATLNTVNVELDAAPELGDLPLGARISLWVGGESTEDQSEIKNSEGATSQETTDKHWKAALHGGTVESHKEFLLHGHKKLFCNHPSKKALQNHIARLSKMLSERKEREAYNQIPPCRECGSDGVGGGHEGSLAMAQTAGKASLVSYPVSGKIFFRDSTNEWVLELTGSINGVLFTARHTQPYDIRHSEVLGLPSLYESEPDVAGLVEALERARNDLSEWIASYPDSSHACTSNLIKHIDSILADRRGRGGEV